MATYVLVHGGGHGGWCFKKVRRLLEAEGHAVYAPTLTGLGERSHLLSPDVDLETHITDVVELLFYEDLHEVVLVGHSYGAMVIEGIADRAGSRVGKLVYLDAMSKAGRTAVDRFPALVEMRKAGRVVDGVELVLFPSEELRELFGVTDPEDIEWVRPRLTPHPWKCFDQPLTLENEDALDAIPQFHIVATATLPGRDQDLIAKARAEHRFWDIDSGHDLMITEPETVARLLLTIAAGEANPDRRS
jgi:pimeloyl-ACP methyl ester carboxylesterase